MMKIFQNRIITGAVTVTMMQILAGLPVAGQASDDSTPTQFAPCDCKDVMSATQIANAFHAELAQNPDFDQQVPIVTKYLQLITLDAENMPEDRLERLALGDAAFLTFQVQPAHDYFASLLDGDDLVALHAWQRMMQITKRALGEDEKAFQMVEQFYHKFPPSELNYHGRYQQIVNFTSDYLGEGKAEDAIALIVDELRALPTNAPYQSWSLLPRYSDEINKSPRRNEIRELVANKLAGLKDLNRKWSQEKYLASDDPVLRGDMPVWYWINQRVRPGESLRAARKRQLTGLIENLEKWLDSQ